MRVAIVNDMALAREVLRRLVLSVPGYEIAWLAADGAEAVRHAGEDRPDVILMDLIMPGMDGAEATRQIMARSPCPILLVTADVTANYPRVYEAMGHGGLDAVDTPVLEGGTIRGGEGVLARLAKVDRLRPFLERDNGRPVSPPSREPVPPLVALGASAGGPAALAEVLSGLPPGLPAAVVIVQHIAAQFAPGLATWLQGRSRLPVRTAAEGDSPTPGVVLVAATDEHLVVRPDLRLGHTPHPRDCPWRPCIDVFFRSAAEHWPRPGGAALLTGMGNDGAEGLGELRRVGWLTIAQDEASSAMPSMPRAAAERKAASRVLPLPCIAAVLAEEARKEHLP
jgi:two-component system response regulator WspF